MDTENTGTEELSDDTVDGLLNEQTPSKDISMASAKQEAMREYTLKVNGQEIKAPEDKVLQWAQMGYNYPQKAAELKAQHEQTMSKIQDREKYLSELEQKISPYRQVDEYAQKNPDWWTQVNSQYQQKALELKGTEDMQRVQKDLEDFKSFKNEMMTEKEQQRLEQEDEKLSGEIKTIRDSYPNIDFNTPDAEGKSLEMKILEHAVNNDIKSFKTAYRDYYHEHLLGKAQEQGKEAIVKDMQRRTKLGFLGETSKSAYDFKSSSNLKSKSYNDLMREALDELNSNNGG